MCSPLSIPPVPPLPEVIVRFITVSFLAALLPSLQAANPECLLEDFVRWYSPRDWIEELREADVSEPMQEESHRVQGQECSEPGERNTQENDSMATTTEDVTSNLLKGEGDMTLEDSTQKEVGGASELGMEGGDVVKSASSEAVEGEGWGEEWEEDWDFVAGEDGEGEKLEHSTENKDEQVSQEPQKKVSLRNFSIGELLHQP